MSAVRRFEDLVAWQKARELVMEIYRVTRLGDFSRDLGLKDQIRRASVSVMSNVAEGFERGSRADFHRFLVMAKGSCAEVRCQVYVAQDVGYLDSTEGERLIAITSEVGRIINGLRAAVQKQRDGR